MGAVGLGGTGGGRELVGRGGGGRRLQLARGRV